MKNIIKGTILIIVALFLSGCDQTETTIIGEPPVIELDTNLDYISIEQGESFELPVCIATDDIDGEIECIVTGAPEDSSESGIYKIEYDAVDSHGNHAETVDFTIYIQENLPPTVSLSKDEITIRQGEELTEDDIYCHVDDDKELIDMCQHTEFPEDLSEAGEYEVYYFASDSVGNESERVKLTITVTPNSAPLPTEEFKEVLEFEMNPYFTIDINTFFEDSDDEEINIYARDLPEDLREIDGIIELPSFKSLKAGEHKITLYASDGAYSKSFEVTLKIVPPQATPEICFTFDEETQTITDYDYECGGGMISIPQTINGLQVLTIGTLTFDDLPEVSVYIPDGVTTIERNAFWTTRIKGLYFGEGLETVGIWAFTNILSETIYLPDSLKSFSASSFVHNRGHYIPLVLSENNENIIKENGLFLSADRKTVLAPSYELDGEAIIPEGVTTIAPYAFFIFKYDITLPETLLTIEEGAFWNMKATSIVIPDSVTIIKESAFRFTELTSVIIGDGVITIEDKAFGGSKLTEVILGESVEYIGEDAFTYNQLTEIILGESVEYIGRFAFSGNQLTEVVIPDSVNFIGLNAFNQGRSGEDIYVTATIPLGRNYSYYNSEIYRWEDIGIIPEE